MILRGSIGYDLPVARRSIPKSDCRVIAYDYGLSKTGVLIDRLRMRVNDNGNITRLPIRVCVLCFFLPLIHSQQDPLKFRNLYSDRGG